MQHDLLNYYIRAKDRCVFYWQVLQDFIYQSSYEPWLKTECGGTGSWKSIVIRSTIKGDVMLIFEFHPQRNPQVSYNVKVYYYCYTVYRLNIININNQYK